MANGKYSIPRPQAFRSSESTVAEVASPHVSPGRAACRPPVGTILGGLRGPKMVMCCSP